MEQRAERLHKSKDQGACCDIVSPNNVRSCTLRILPAWLSHVSWRRMIPVDTPVRWGENSWGLNPTQRSISNWVKLGAREMVLPREEHHNWLSGVHQSTLKTHRHVTLYRLNIHICMLCMHTWNNSEKEALDLKQGREVNAGEFGGWGERKEDKL